MPLSDELVTAGADIFEAQRNHPFVQELARGELAPAAFEHWLRQDYRYLLDYARTFAIGAGKAREEATMTRFINIARITLDFEMDLHREFAEEYGITREQLETTQKAPTCAAYTDFLVRTAIERPIPVIAAAVYPCGKGYLDVAEYMAELATEKHRYTPFIEKYTSDEFRDTVDWMASLIDRYGTEYPGYQQAMHEAFQRSAQLEYAFWEMCYTQEHWAVSPATDRKL